jgi:hypothetical protein
MGQHQRLCAAVAGGGEQFARADAGRVVMLAVGGCAISDLILPLSNIGPILDLSASLEDKLLKPLALPREAREANCINGLAEGLGRSCPIDLQFIPVAQPKPPHPSYAMRTA